jgi:hypothetical protein
MDGILNTDSYYTMEADFFGKRRSPWTYPGAAGKDTSLTSWKENHISVGKQYAD